MFWERVAHLAGFDFPQDDVARIGSRAGFAVRREGNRGNDAAMSTFEFAQRRLGCLRRRHVPQTCFAVLGAGEAILLRRALGAAGHGADTGLVDEPRGLVVATAVPNTGGAIVANGDD